VETIPGWRTCRREAHKHRWLMLGPLCSAGVRGWWLFLMLNFGDGTSCVVCCSWRCRQTRQLPLCTQRAVHFDVTSENSGNLPNKT
jgi:hypothetical protein